MFDPSRVGGDLVQLEVERVAEEERMAAWKEYYIIESYLKLDFHCKYKD